MKTNDASHRPIGVFDSGFGGISVLASIMQEMPNERFLYFGDNLHAPYGSLPENEIMRHTQDAVRFLVDHGCKAIVIACNTATSVAAVTLRQTLSLPIIAMEPALKPASMLSGDGLVLVLATEVTLKLEKFHRLMDSYGKDAVPIPCPKLVSAVESGITEGTVMEELLHEYLDSWTDRPVKAVVLGCTHFVFLKKALRAFLKPQIMLIDGNLGTARQLKKRLIQESLINRDPLPEVEPRVQFYTTKQNDTTLDQMEPLLRLASDQL